jgi:hypothetical protein
MIEAKEFLLDIEDSEKKHSLVIKKFPAMKAGALMAKIGKVIGPIAKGIDIGSDGFNKEAIADIIPDVLEQVGDEKFFELVGELLKNSSLNSIPLDSEENIERAIGSDFLLLVEVVALVLKENFFFKGAIGRLTKVLGTKKIPSKEELSVN